MTADVTMSRERVRQAAVEAYGLAGADLHQTEDAELTQLAELAQQLSEADGAVIQIMDGDRQVVIASSVPMPVQTSSRASSVCNWALGQSVDGGVVSVGDASIHPDLLAGPWVTGQLGRVRFYAGAPLLTSAGQALGAVCVWSLDPTADPAGRSRNLGSVRDAIVAVLESRRLVRDLIASNDPHGARTPRMVPAHRDWSIDKIIDERAIDTVFQPIVHLTSGEIVGFEALSRGPADTPLTSPDALLAAARGVGRLGELDWVCRIHAMQAATRSGFSPQLSWFINVEPAGLAIDCPEHLRPALDQACGGLRVILEVVERDVEDNGTGLLLAVERARNDAWGIALDDVGAEEASLGLLVLLQPDVVKLDMSMLRGQPHAAVATVTAAVRAYAQRRGAVILAEGIETDEQVALAQLFGATLGQGFRYGRPGRLPPSVPVPREVINLSQRPVNPHGRTPFEILAPAVPPEVAPKRLLLHISAHLEAYAADHDHSSVMLVGFQRAAFFSPTKLALYRGLAEHNALTLVAAEGVPRIDEHTFHVTCLPQNSAMAGEWQVILITAHYAAAFVARDLGDDGPDRDRRFEFIYTHDRDQVIAAARAYVQNVDVSPTRSGPAR